jgi:hypothetical protein
MTFAINFVTSFAALEALSAITTSEASEDPTNRNVIIANATWALAYEVTQSLRHVPGASLVAKADPIFAELLAPIIGAAAGEVALYLLDRHHNLVEDIDLGDAIMRFTAVNIAKALI